MTRCAASRVISSSRSRRTVPSQARPRLPSPASRTSATSWSWRDRANWSRWRAPRWTAITEVKLLSTIARQGTHANVRIAALERLSETPDLLAVAIKTEHRDVGLAALARLTQDRDTLETVAVRARSKVVQRRARGALHALAEVDEIVATTLPAAQRRQQVCDILDALASSSDLSRAEERLGALEREWAALAGEPAEDVAARYARGVERLRELLARSADERAAHEQQMRQVAEETEAAAASRLAICERIEALDGPEAAAGLDEGRTIWVAQSPWPEVGAELDPGAAARRTVPARVCRVREADRARRGARGRAPALRDPAGRG